MSEISTQTPLQGHPRDAAVQLHTRGIQGTGSFLLTFHYIQLFLKEHRNLLSLHLFARFISVFRECPKSGWWRFAGRTVTRWPWKSPTTRGQCSSTRDTCSGCGTWTAGDTWTCLLVWLPSAWATATRKVLCLRLLCHTRWCFVPMWGW